jgi:hypothetical protein
LYDWQIYPNSIDQPIYKADGSVVGAPDMYLIAAPNDFNDWSDTNSYWAAVNPLPDFVVCVDDVASPPETALNLMKANYNPTAPQGGGALSGRIIYYFDDFPAVNKIGNCDLQSFSVFTWSNFTTTSGGSFFGAPEYTMDCITAVGDPFTFTHGPRNLEYGSDGVWRLGGESIADSSLPDSRYGGKTLAVEWSLFIVFADTAQESLCTATTKFFSNGVLVLEDTFTYNNVQNFHSFQCRQPTGTADGAYFLLNFDMGLFNLAWGNYELDHEALHEANLQQFLAYSDPNPDCVIP